VSAGIAGSSSGVIGGGSAKLLGIGIGFARVEREAPPSKLENGKWVEPELGLRGGGKRGKGLARGKGKK